MSPDPEERLWLQRIERLRGLLALSTEAVEFADFGAGPAARYDNGDLETVHREVRTVGRMTTYSKPPQWAYLLFRLVRELKPASVLELGSCVGISACYQAAALELNGSGRLVTLEGAEPLARRSARSLEELGLQHRATVRTGRFADTLDDAVAAQAPIGLAFIDGHHIEEATLHYGERILSAADSEAVLVFDDINWSAGMRRAWQQIAEDHRFALTVQMRSFGLAVVSKSATSRHEAAVSFG